MGPPSRGGRRPAGWRRSPPATDSWAARSRSPGPLTSPSSTAAERTYRARRDAEVPAVVSGAAGGAPALGLDVRTARFREADGTTRLGVYWAPAGCALALSPVERAALPGVGGAGAVTALDARLTVQDDAYLTRAVVGGRVLVRGPDVPTQTAARPPRAPDGPPRPPGGRARRRLDGRAPRARPPRLGDRAPAGQVRDQRRAPGPRPRVGAGGPRWTTGPSASSGGWRTRAGRSRAGPRSPSTSRCTG